ncbi:DUF4209 domain-containing protein [Deinococcus sp. AJ005]|uniref:DUF4209 domain-containing protein n=1 Tax=Deinococcus sp. AJ005 TaxID=2652443 RepID=UPI00125CBF40|nr:DUF4209 domain-containing protein [Deinococcus sp. AJ005]QFP76280.1 DUF4209 domain-containing protein [Deinococcus sp. AJ005]
MTHSWPSVLAQLNIPNIIGDGFSALAFGPLIDRLKQAEADEDEDIQLVCRILACAAILHFHPDSEKTPYGSPTDNVRNRLFDRGQMTAEASTVFSAVAEHVEHSSLQARANDLLWVFAKDHAAGQRAVQHYLDVANQAKDSEEWVRDIDALVRAANLSLSLGRGAVERATVTAALEKHAQDPRLGTTWAAARLMEMLLERGAGEPVTYSVIATQYAQAAQDAQHWHLAHHYWIIASKWHSRADNTAARNAARIDAAEMRVADGETALQGGGKKLYAASWIETAIRELRGIPGTKERVRALRLQLIDLQADSVEEFGTISVPLGEEHFRNVLELARKQVKADDPTDAVIKLGRVATEQSVGALRKAAEEELSAPSLRSLFSTKYVDGMGRMKASTGTSDEARIDELMRQRQTLTHQTFAFPFLYEARTALLDEHIIHRDHLMPLLDGNPFIPAGHSYAILLGLEAGLRGDFITAASLLTPKFETLLRHILEHSDVITTSLAADGVQDSIELNRLLREDEFLEPLRRWLGEDFVFELQGLLVSRYGYNFRNDLAHGLVPDSLAQRIGELIWHAALRIVCLPIPPNASKVEETLTTPQNS